ncbi:efflux RND transporter permease subunit, partial [Candidatus Dependentiae bacterium]|nr:efflux RND transporter permease subunit [Candidatus Dependentiae bacterium]
MKLPEISVTKPVTTLMFFILILLGGIFALINLPVDLMPDITIPTITVITIYPGASPEDIEKKITEPIEEALSTIQNVKTVTSTSEENVSSVVLHFEWGVDLVEAQNDIRDKVEFIKRFLPEDAEDPIIFKFDLSQAPILFIGVNAPDDYPNFYETVDDKIVKPLQRVPGVGLVALRGGRQKQVRIDLDYEKMKVYKISINSIISALEANNVSLPGGKVKYGQKELLIRVPGEFKTIDEIRELVLYSNSPKLIKLKDVAEVYEGKEKLERMFRLNQKDGILVFIQSQSGENPVQLSDRLWKKFKQIKKELPPEIEAKIILDLSDYLRDTIKSLTSTILLGGLLVILVIWVFLGQIRGSFIIAFTLPFSIMAAFIFLYLADFSINMISLFSIAIAIGMVVDNAIVIFDNIHRHHYERHESLKEASIHAPSEVGMAVVASSLTTIVIFLPLIFTRGFVGELFSQLGKTLIFVLLASLFTSLTLTPMLASKLLKPYFKMKKKKKKKVTFFHHITEIYESILISALKHKLIVYSICLLMFVSAIFLVQQKYIGSEFLPEEDQGQIFLSIELPTSTNLDAAFETAIQIEELIEKFVPEEKSIMTNLGPSDGFSQMGFKEATNIINISIYLDAKKVDRRSSKEIANIIREEVGKNIPNIVKLNISDVDPIAALISGRGGKSIQVEIIGESFDETDKLAFQIKTEMDGIEGLKNVSITRDKAKEEVIIKIDRLKAANFGLNIYSIAETIRKLYYGYEVGKFRKNDNEYDIFMRLKEEYSEEPFNLKDIYITNYQGKRVPFSNFATLEFGTGPIAIEHKDRSRIVIVEANQTGEIDLGKIRDILEGRIKKLYIPADVKVEISGSIESMEESFGDLGMAFVIGLILVYMVMAAQFESFKSPFIIMFTIPFGVVGVVYGLFLTGHTLNINSLVGLVILIGIVVNNGIVLVDYINILRAREVPLFAAI